jgi:hypothetical protein
MDEGERWIIGMTIGVGTTLLSMLIGPFET